MNLKEQIDPKRIPLHVAIIMDGNGRWAKQKGESRIMGHISGVESVRESLTAATELGVKHLTLYAFSTENWNRPKEEVDALMNLLVNTIAQEIASLSENGVRLKAIGDIDNLPESCKAALFKAIDQTSNNTTIELILALSYSSRWEIVNATRKIAEMVKKGTLDPASISEDTIHQHLTTKGIPDPELLIRTSGEKRISNFLLWQCAYTEFYFTKTLWPDFKKEHFYEAIAAYQQRERRFGMVSEQLNSDAH
ncbi:MAG TPA: isoprenyl transferase [Flavobacteriales bacterium]|nr:isoprenyl transferase [Flavobacteriales bacterium]HCA83193.1 isoprenyl transferase [Flavobacteriales bacterium]HRE73379.1 isoprenyl transferase [Flavobacteriales bacterium]HRJ36703.1 isoprenyl transferase [Flavobacteriales bacterium]HRJ38562.1 isoprenyl transferase [Flavobacteriales bacterium]